MKKLILLALITLCAVSTATFAEDHPSDSRHNQSKQCYENAKTTLEIRQCINKEYKHFDTALNKRYKKLMSLLETKKQKQQLIASQRAWLDFRKKDCQLAGLSAEGGTLQPVRIGLCIIDRNKKRIKELSSFIKDFGPH